MATSRPMDSAAARLAFEGAVMLDGIVPLATLDALRGIARAALPIGRREYFSTLTVGGRDYREHLHASLAGILANLQVDTCPGYRCFLYGFAVKPPSGSASELGPHRDTSMVSFGGRPPLVMWIPLFDASEKDGCLQVVRGSHVEVLGPRAYGVEPAVGWEERRSQMAVLPVVAGDCVVFDGRLLHMSGGNFGDVSRVAVMALLCPIEEFVAYYRIDPVDSEFLLEHRADDEFYVRSGMRPPAKLDEPVKRWPRYRDLA